nr:Uncharacterised protein [Streptococcus thermophilus]
MDDIPAFEVDAANVTLEDDGDGEKRQLVYAGSEQTTTVEVSYGVAQGAVAAESVDPKAPAGGDVDRVTLPLVVYRIGDSAEVRVGEPKHSNLDAGEDALTAEDFRMRWRQDVHGNIDDVKLLPPEGSSDEGRAIVERALLQLLAAQPVFPIEPVGEGATWTVETRTIGGARMLRTTRYTVDSLDGDSVVLNLEIEDEPTETELTIDDAGAGDTLTAEEWSTTSEAAITVDLSKPLPSEGQTAATTRIVYTGPNTDFKVVQDVTTATTYGK